MSEPASRFERLLTIQRWAYSQKLKYPSAKAVLVALAFHAGDPESLAWPSFKTLAEETGFSRRIVIYAIKYLEQKGLIHCQRRNRASTQYKCLVQPLHPPSATIAPPLVQPLHPNVPIKNVSIEQGAQPKNGNGSRNGNGNGNGIPPRASAAPPPRTGYHWCAQCDSPHDWFSDDEFDCSSVEMACPDFRARLKSKVRKVPV